MSEKDIKENKKTEQDNTVKENSETNVQEEVSELENLQNKYDELNDKYLRLYSDFDNYRKRTQKEKLDLISNASESTIKSMLSILDDFERAISNNVEVDKAETLREGFHLIYNKFLNTLESKGLKSMESKGKPFDLELHEAVTQIPAKNKKDKGTCFDVIERGYYLNDKVLRYAKVVVAQ